jgi:alpha-L-fucosidase
LIHRLQPQALIVPNHHQRPRAGEDVQTFEQDLPGANTAGFNTSYVSGNLPLETSLTMNDSWGFNITDTNYKSVRAIVGYLVRAAGNGGNLLLNVGPRPDGTISPAFAARLDSVGSWLATNGTAIYGTRRGPVPPRSWGATTRRGDTVFVHVLDWPDPLLALPPLGRRVRSARMLGGGVPVPFQQSSLGLTLQLPRSGNEIDRVVVLVTGP